MNSSEPADGVSAVEAQQRPWLVASLALIGVALLLNALAAWTFRSDVQSTAEPLADMLGEQLADAAAPLILSNNQISLQALAHKATRHRSVAHTAFYNVQNELLAQSGRSSMADQGQQIRTAISLQDRLLGYCRIALTAQPPPMINAGRLNLLAGLLGLLGLGALARLFWFANQEKEKPKASLLDNQADERYQQLPEPAGEYGIIAVELLQLPLMRRQLSEDTLYEYLTTFEHWLEQVAELYSAAIRVGETGFTLSISVDDSDGSGSASELVERVACCAFALMKALNAANLQRSARSEPVYEARVGVHISSPLQSEARLLRELYAQDAHRQAWLACSGKASGTITLSHSVISHDDCVDLQITPPDQNGFYQLTGLNSHLLLNVNEKVHALPEVSA